MVESLTKLVEAMDKSLLVSHFDARFGVLLRFYPKIDGVSCQVSIRGYRHSMQSLEDAVAYFCCLSQINHVQHLINNNTSV